jgi:hypothetical protein
MVPPDRPADRASYGGDRPHRRARPHAGGLGPYRDPGADIRDFFGQLDRAWLERFLRHRIAEERVLRLIGRWLAAGVVEEGVWNEGAGAPQGASVTPPTQWPTRRLVTLRVRCLVFLIAVAGRTSGSTPVPEAGAQCASSARWDLSGGPPQGRSLPGLIAAMWMAWLMCRFARSDSRWTFRSPEDTSTGAVPLQAAK